MQRLGLSRLFFREVRLFAGIIAEIEEFEHGAVIPFYELPVTAANSSKGRAVLCSIVWVMVVLDNVREA